VLVGSVLEDHLRKLCAKYPAIVLTAKATIEPRNVELVKAGAYNEMVAATVRVWTAVRNKAAHAEWGTFKSGDVEDMLRGIRRFIAEHPA
jgi:hypothetical protein